MKKDDYFIMSLLRAVATFAYVSGVAWLLSNGERFFGEEPRTFLIPVFMLLLFIVSASITGFLVLGKPILLYLNGEKKEAVTMLFATLGWLCAFLVAVAIFLVVR